MKKKNPQKIFNSSALARVLASVWESSKCYNVQMLIVTAEATLTTIKAAVFLRAAAAAAADFSPAT